MNQVPSIFNNPNRRAVGRAIADSLGQAKHPRISLEGDRFTLVDAAGEHYPWPQFHMDVVMVNANPATSKIFYDGPYDPNESSPPTCWSDNGIAPSTQSGRKICFEVGQSGCATCPLNAWGSDPRMSGKGKLCKDRKKIAVLVLFDDTKLMYELQVPSASLGNLATYINKTAAMATPNGERAADVTDVVTRISWGQGKVLEFTCIAWLYSVGADQKLYVDNQGNPAMAPDGGQGMLQRLVEDFESGYSDTLIGTKDQPATMGTGQYQPQVTQQAAAQIAAPAPAAPQQQRVVTPFPGQQGHVAAQPVAVPVQQPAADTQPAQMGGAGALAQAQPAQAPKAGGRGGARPGAGRKPTTVAPAPSQALQQPQAVQQEILPPGTMETGRTHAAPAPMAAAGPAPGGGMPDLPAFMQRNANPLPAGGPAVQAGHGFEAPAAPTVDLTKAINLALGLKSGGPQ